MKVKTSELSGAALDWAVAVCEVEHFSHLNLRAIKHFLEVRSQHVLHRRFHYSTDWSQGGPIIDREKIELFVNHSPLVWSGFITKYPKGLSHYTIQQSGSVPLIAAMRCFVAFKLGEKVEIPEELIK